MRSRKERVEGIAADLLVRLCFARERIAALGDEVDEAFDLAKSIVDVSDALYPEPEALPPEGFKPQGWRAQ